MPARIYVSGANASPTRSASAVARSLKTRSASAVARSLKTARSNQKKMQTGEPTMKKLIVFMLMGVACLFSETAGAQSPKAATYITDAQVKAVNALPGVDRQIVSVDIGKLNEAVGVIHRGPTRPQAGGRGAAAPVPAAESCGEKMSTPPADGTAAG